MSSSVTRSTAKRLYKDILRQHRFALPPKHRELGDRYVRSVIAFLQYLTQDTIPKEVQQTSTDIQSSTSPHTSWRVPANQMTAVRKGRGIDGSNRNTNLSNATTHLGISINQYCFLLIRALSYIVDKTSFERKSRPRVCGILCRTYTVLTYTYTRYFRITAIQGTAGSSIYSERLTYTQHHHSSTGTPIFATTPWHVARSAVNNICRNLCATLLLVLLYTMYQV